MGAEGKSRATDPEPTPGERHTRALLALTHAVWRDDCSLNTAFGAICEAAAEALQVSRVNVWRYMAEDHRIECVHAYTLDDHRHVECDLETLTMDGSDYIASLKGVRAFDAADIDADPSAAPSYSALREYLHRHDIRSFLDASVRVEGRLLGVICHEQVGHQRSWTPEEVAFAGSMGDYVAMAMEIQRRREAEQQVAHLRLHDAGTDLPNRDYLLEHLRVRLRAPQDVESVIAIVHARIVLPYGTSLPADAPTVEEVMTAVAGQLRQRVGAVGTLARVRSDGFAVMPQRKVGERHAVRLAEHCVDAVRELSPWRGVDIGAAIGVAFAHDVPDRSARVLLRNAELAGERAQAQGRYRFEVFDVEHHRGLVERLQLEQAMREALEGDAFEVHYQPEFDLTRDAWAGAEALLRWRRDGVLLPACEFIEAAENSGLILPLGRRVLARACLDACHWPVQQPPLMLRVNVSAQQFAEPSLVGEVATALAESGLAPQRLCLEITETTLMRDTEEASQTLRELKRLGVGLAIDDFGTGYASLAYLKRFPIDAIKIDRSFVAGLPDEPYDCAIIAAIGGLAQTLGLEVVAEGVERAAQRDALRKLGLQRMQGLLYAPALDQAALLATLRRPPASSLH